MSTDKPTNPSSDTADHDSAADITLPKPPARPEPRLCDESDLEAQYYDEVPQEDSPENYAELYEEAPEDVPPEAGPPPPPTPEAHPEPDAAIVADETPEDAPEDDTPTLRSRTDMSLWEHLEELRGTLIKSLAVLVVGMIVVGIFFSQANDILLWPLNQALEGRPDRAEFLRMNTMFGVFSVIFEIAIVGGLLVSMPFIIYFFARFVAPALTEKEKRILVPCCCAALGLFLFGVLFSYFVLLPAGIQVALSINESMGFYLQPNVQDYYNLIVWMMAGVGLVFEFPLLLLVLIYLELIRPQTLRKYRRYVIVAIAIIAAAITPPDVISQVLLALPLYVLYELTIWIGGILLKRKHASAEAEAAV